MCSADLLTAEGCPEKDSQVVTEVAIKTLGEQGCGGAEVYGVPCGPDPDVASQCCYFVDGIVYECGGRPFLVGGAPLVAESCDRSDWLALFRPQINSLDEASRDLLSKHWQSEAQFEHASVASFARFALELLSLGAPASLVEAAQRAFGRGVDVWAIGQDAPGNAALVERFALTAPMLDSLRRTARLLSTHFSTQIEGNQLSPLQVQAVVEGEGNFPGRERDEAEVRHYFAALEYVERISEKPAILNEKEIRTIHGLVMTGKAQLTRYRTAQNVIRDSRTGRTVYMPPEAKDVPGLMKELVAWVNDSVAEGELPVPCLLYTSPSPRD